VPEGEVCPQPISAPVLLDYLCRVAEVGIPWKTHGRDIRPLLKNPATDDWRSVMMMTHTGRSYGAETDEIPTDERLIDTGKVPWYVLLRSGNLKYVRTLVAGQTEELCDLKRDPEELKNLARDAAYAGQLQALREQAVSELTRTDAGFVDRMPATKQMLEAE
jgi:arylsulfatase A-like enzyme